MMKVLKFSKSVFNQIANTIGKLPPECGGVLGAGKDGVITAFFYDKTGQSTVSAYIPDVETINTVLREEWMPQGIVMVGIVHSHNGNNRVPSCGDIDYGIRILQALDTVNEFYLPIVTAEDDKISISCYAIQEDDNHDFVCRRIDYSVVDV